MATTDLAAFKVQAGVIVYLDTSAVLPLALAETGEAPEIEARRAQKLTPFVEALVRAQSRVISSVLSIEEVAFLTRTRQRSLVADEAGYKDWRAFEKAKPAEAEKASKEIQAYVLEILEHAANALGKLKITIEQPEVPSGRTAEAGKKLRKLHRELLRAYEKIDAMDALHIVFGGELGCKHFVSFDKAWRDVRQIEVLK